MLVDNYTRHSITFEVNQHQGKQNVTEILCNS